MEAVMNNPDLRGIIFSFFKTKYYNRCNNCKKPCRISKDRIENKYVSWAGFVNCHECFKDGFIGNRIVFKKLNLSTGTKIINIID